VKVLSNGSLYPSSNSTGVSDELIDRLGLNHPSASLPAAEQLTERLARHTTQMHLLLSSTRLYRSDPQVRPPARNQYRVRTTGSGRNWPIRAPGGGRRRLFPPVSDDNRPVLVVSKSGGHVSGKPSPKSIWGQIKQKKYQ